MEQVRQEQSLERAKNIVERVQAKEAERREKQRRGLQNNMQSQSLNRQKIMKPMIERGSVDLYYDGDGSRSIPRQKPKRLYEKMELAAKLRQEEIEKDKRYKLRQNRMEHLPVNSNELKRHAEKVDRQIAEAHDRRELDKLGGIEVKDLVWHDVRRFDAPIVQRNFKTSETQQD